MTADVSALILAGGKATRMGGIAKHELVVDGKAIIDRQLDVLVPRVREVILSGPYEGPSQGMLPMVAWKNMVTQEAYGPFRLARDRVEGIGPLAGIAAGLAACKTDWMLVVAGDMPYLTGALIDRMIAETAHDKLYPPPNEASPMQLNAVGIMNRGLPEPLVCALHRWTMLPAVENRIALKRYKASGLLTEEGMNVRWITDADPAALRNVNSPEDL